MSRLSLLQVILTSRQVICFGLCSSFIAQRFFCYFSICLSGSNVAVPQLRWRFTNFLLFNPYAPSLAPSAVSFTITSTASSSSSSFSALFVAKPRASFFPALVDIVMVRLTIPFVQCHLVSRFQSPSLL